MMFEVLRAQPIEVRRLTAKLALADKLVCADFSNVSDYYFRHDREVWEIEHFPGCLSPWPVAWIEWHAPGRIRSLQYGERSVPALAWAVQILRVPIDEKAATPDVSRAAAYYRDVSRGFIAGPSSPAEFFGRAAEAMLGGARFIEGVRWFTSYTVLCPALGKAALAIIGTFHTERGDPILVPGLGGSYSVGVSLQQLAQRVAPFDDANGQTWFNFIDSQALKVALLGFSLANCKNVRQETALPSRLAVGARPGRAKFNPKDRGDGLGRVTYRTLRIEPMTAKGRQEQRDSEVGGRSRLHICRGHFKDFREKGLFGKYHGVYWWESQLRGDPERGRVHKDYAV